MTVKMGAAAWITAVSPASRCVSANPSSQNGIALLNAPRTTIGSRWPRRGFSPPRPGQQSEQRQRPEHEPPECDDGGLERLDADLDEQERRAPDRGEEEQEEGVASRHGVGR